jgi:hypothetical protein
MLRHIGIVSQSKKLKAADVAATAAAVQKQVSRDFGPIWQVEATVSYFAKLTDVPLGYWPVIIKDNINEQGAGGVHLDDNKQPYALVQAEDYWQLATSHETLEMLADPFGSRLQTGVSPKRGEGRVQFLVEVCDPCEATAYAYHVNGILISDFFTPHFFDPAVTPAARYSFTGAITQPRQVLKGGYLSWFDPVTKHWLQEDYLGSKPRIRDLGPMNIRDTIRGTLDGLRGAPPWHQQRAPKRDASAKATLDAGTAMAASLERSIAELA